MNLLNLIKRKKVVQKRETQITPPISDPLLRALFEGEVITREKSYDFAGCSWRG